MAKFNQIEKLLKDKGIDFKVINFPGVVVSVEDVMRVAGDQIKREEITKSLIVKLKCGDFVDCILKGDDRLDKNVLLSDGRHTDQPVARLATKEEVLEVAGVEIGAVCPILLDIPVIFDEKVMSLTRINLGSGDLLKGLEMNFADLISLVTNYKINKIAVDNKGRRILTGDRPTGKLHLGHYIGSLRNRVRLQDEYECFFIIADLHTLTTRPEKTLELKENIYQMALDYLSVGIDPQKATIYVQSQIPEVGELAIIFANLVTVPRLERMPTLKDVMRDADIQIPSYGLLGYPVLQAADILMVKGDLVPVGKDQQSHIEVTREIAREFNRIYDQVFPVPEALIPGDIPTLPGTDGALKMSKSAGNVINLSDSPEEVEKKVMNMYTDPKRVHPTDPGTVEGNPVFVYLDAFGTESDKEKVKSLKERYTKGQVGDIEVKKYLIIILNNFLDPIRKKRAEFEKQPELVDRILKEGTEKARKEAQKTLLEVKAAMKLDHFQ